MNSQKYLDELFELLSIPSVSAQKEHDGDIAKTCTWLKRRLETLHFTADILPTQGHPVVYAEHLKAGKDAPTVLIYGHYDVQSPDPLEEWSSKPFEPEIRSGNIYARGAADDKGQFYTWIAAISELGEKLPVNIKFLLEGEEEVGSVNLDNFLKENLSLLKADICVISDSHCISADTPVICYGVRGLTYMEVTVRTLSKDAHSGIYGGNVLNPANVLSSIISKLKDDSGKISIPGFYDDVRELSSTEREKLSHYPFTQKEIEEEVGATVVFGEQGFTTQERAGARPTLDVNGIWGGYTQEGPKTIIPATASAKISMRLVPNQSSADVAEKFTTYIKTLVPEGATIDITVLSTGEPAVMNISHPFFAVANAAYKKVFGNEPLYELSGGSIPITYTLKHLLEIDSLMMGYGLPDDGLHSPNEKLSVEMFEKGIATNIEFLTNIALVK
jgi:acetylornithine deacetylase/succinyl-diaminopimelate desuccinylase-like protein